MLLGTVMDTTPKPQFMEEIIDNLDFLKMKTSAHLGNETGRQHLQKTHLIGTIIQNMQGSLGTH